MKLVMVLVIFKKKDRTIVTSSDLIDADLLIIFFVKPSLATLSLLHIRVHQNPIMFEIHNGPMLKVFHW